MISCSEDNSDSEASTTDDVASLAKVTEEVSSTSSKLQGKAESVGTFAATTGVKLSEASSLTWSSTHNRAMCESITMVKDLLQEASQPDVILCYVGVMRRNGAFTGTIDDGNYHTFALSGDSEMGQLLASSVILW